MTLCMRIGKHIVRFNLSVMKDNLIFVLGGLLIAAAVYIVPVIIAILFGGY